MDNIFRCCCSGRLRSTDLIKKIQSGISQNIINEFWNLTTNNSKRIILTLKNAAGNIVASTLVKYVVFENMDGNPYNYRWMEPISKGVVTTTADGVFEVLYTGCENVGGKAYVTIMHPSVSSTESMIWDVIIQ